MRGVRLLAGAFAVLFASAALANDDLLALQRDPANVTMPGVTYAGWNYSPLDQINLSNVVNLAIAWTWQIGILDAHEAPPLVIGDTMYLVSPKPNYVYALDLATDGVTIWEFRPDMNVETVARQSCCGAKTRGLYYAQGKIFYATADGQVFALDAVTGEVIWRALATDLGIGETTVGTGIVVGDLFLVGNAGGERGVRGKVQAFDIASGASRWTMYSMGPDADVGIGPRFSPFYADDRRGSLATWYGNSWQRGGGTVWGYFTFDPASNLVHYSTGNCGPWNPDYRRDWGVVTLDARGGLIDYRNNWCASQLARDATSGELIWAYNIVPADNWDQDQPGITPLIDLTIDGVLRETAVKAARNGYFYVFDRNTGELLVQPWPFRYVDFMTGVDRATGRALYAIDKWSFTDVEDRRRYTTAGTLAAGAPRPDNYTGTEINWCPGNNARSWQNDAWSPRASLLYTSTTTGCATQVVIEGTYTPGEGYTLRRNAGIAPVARTGPDGRLVPHVGELQANDPLSSRTAWRHAWPSANNTPILATAGDLLFQIGSDQGVIRAINALTGEFVWSFRTGGPGNVSPVSYTGPDGRQYMAYIASAPAGSPPVFADAAADAAARYGRSGSTLYVFALPRSFLRGG